MSPNRILGLMEWYNQEDKVMEFKNRFMVRGAGILWILLYWTMWIAYLSVICSSYKYFDLFSIILPGIIGLIFGIIFSFVEIRRIGILKKYEKYASEHFTKMVEIAEKAYHERIEEIEQQNKIQIELHNHQFGSIVQGIARIEAGLHKAGIINTDSIPYQNALTRLYEKNKEK